MSVTTPELKCPPKDSGFSLALTALDAFWDDNRPLLFLGPWCLRGANRNAWQGRVGRLLDTPWNDLQRVESAYQYCDKVYRDLLPRMAVALNHMHGVNHAVEYWRIVVGYWLYHYIQTFYERYETVRMALTDFRVEAAVGLAREDWRPTRDADDYAAIIFDDPYNLQLYSQILVDLGVPLESRRGPGLRTAVAGTPRGAVFRAVAGLAGRFSRVLARRSPVILVNSIFSEWEAWRLWWRSRGAVQPFLDRSYFHNLRPSVTQPGLRKTLCQIDDGGDPLVTSLIKSLPYNLPHSCVEEYPAHLEYVRRKWPEGPRVVLTSFLFTSNDVGKIWLAERRERDRVKIVAIQHSGVYGVYEREFSTHHERDVADQCWSWGFETPSVPNMSPMPSPKMNRIKPITQAGSATRILLLPEELRRYALNFIRSPFGGQSERYLDGLTDLLTGLAPNILKQVRLRARPWIAANDVYASRFPDLAVDPMIERPLADALAASRLIVVTYNGTAFLEALVIGRPVVLVWDPVTNPMHTNAQLCFGFLREAGILHDTPQSAAELINRIYDDAATWWHEPAVRRGRERFLAKFVWLDKDWLRVWHDRILRFASQEAPVTLPNSSARSFETLV